MAKPVEVEIGLIGRSEAEVKAAAAALVAQQAVTVTFKQPSAGRRGDWIIYGTIVVLPTEESMTARHLPSRHQTQ